MTDTDTGTALLRSIVLRPEDMDARLIYADWCEENEQRERAEFIRLQCRIADLQADCHCVGCVRLRGGGGQHHNGPCAVDQEREELPDGRSRQAMLRRRERELLKTHIGAWTDSLPELLVTTACRHCADQSPDWETGVIECRQCECTGRVPNYDGIEFRRGFVESVSCICADWLTHGPQIVASQPVREAVLVDRKPRTILLGQNRQWDWFRYGFAGSNDASHVVPSGIMDLITDSSGAGYDTDHVYRRTYNTERAALQALSTAAVLWARREAGLEQDRRTAAPEVVDWDDHEAQGSIHGQ